MKKPKYKKGDVLGVCGDCMYELRVTSWRAKEGVYACRVVRANAPRPGLKVGQMCGVKPSQVVVKLGENGKKWPV